MSTAEQSRKSRAAKSAYLKQIKAAGSCLDCGGTDALEFHHRDPSTKVDSVSRMLGRGWRVLQAEVDKCDLLCRRCHLLRHAPPRRKRRSRYAPRHT